MELSNSGQTRSTALSRFERLAALSATKQHGLRRDVIKPQNGHILCDAKSPLFMPKIFLNESVIKASTM